MIGRLVVARSIRQASIAANKCIVHATLMHRTRPAAAAGVDTMHNAAIEESSSQSAALSVLLFKVYLSYRSPRNFWNSKEGAVKIDHG
ncbi:hypothetical protein RR48_08489 [Papilio machaon]|uniref:Uncharacterized protein n=1 Tax=Papilio machaon TaxID=76193 RepID=A0A194QV95_PAPMA|nr:hypothetical protein RR48_08489 [Papilio machaon]